MRLRFILVFIKCVDNSSQAGIFLGLVDTWINVHDEIKARKWAEKHLVDQAKPTTDPILVNPNYAGSATEIQHLIDAMKVTLDDAAATAKLPAGV